MNDISLNISFADPGINATLQEMIALYEKTFPGQRGTYYAQPRAHNGMGRNSTVGSTGWTIYRTKK